MTDFSFTPELETVGAFSPVASIADIAEEVGMYSCSPRFVEAHAGPLALSIYQQIPDSFFREAEELNLYPNIDIRVHRLYKGDFPAVPGWHCDGEFRKDYQSQPELDAVVPHKHLVGTISTDADGVSLTEFVTVPHTVTVDTASSKNLWEQVHEDIEANVDRADITTATDGTLYEFGSFTLHRATPAQTRGWRLFLRASMWHKPYLNQQEGELARQEYVYRLSESKGW